MLQKILHFYFFQILTDFIMWYIEETQYWQKMLTIVTEVDI